MLTKKYHFGICDYTVRFYPNHNNHSPSRRGDSGGLISPAAIAGEGGVCFPALCASAVLPPPPHPVKNITAQTIINILIYYSLILC